MQNIGNNLNAPKLSQQPQPVEYLQKHITQLTAYINENNQKYHKNMVTLKEFYEEQAQTLHDQNQDLVTDNTRVNNEVVTVRDLLANSHIRIRQLEQLLGDSEQKEEELRDKLDRERKRNQAIYEGIEVQRKEREKEIQHYKFKISQYQEQNRKLSGELFKHETNIETLNKKKQNLESIVNESYLLPDRIEDLQKDQLEFQRKVKQLNTKNNNLTEEVNHLQVKVGKLQTENESLRIFKANSTSQRKLEIEKTAHQQKQMADGKILKLQKQNQAYMFQLNQAQSKIKTMGRQMEGYERSIGKMRERISELQSQVGAVDRQKSDYIAQFSSLKQEYDAVIQRLEDTLILGQKKNWSLEQENKDLNLQLSSLHQLLNEVKAINNLQAHKPQYRKWAQIEQMAQKETSPLKEERKSEGEDGESGKEWQKLMQDIERIAV